MIKNSLKGKIRITTRCLWPDKGKLLDALHKAAHAALSSLPVNCPLSHMERTVAELLRKMVRKYSSKRPEVIAIALENPAAVLSDEVNARLSGKSHVGYGISALRKVVDGHSEENQSDRMHTEDIANIQLGHSLQKNLKGEGNELERLLPEEDTIASSSSLAERPFSDSKDSDDFWKAFVTSSSPVDEVAKDNNGFVPQSKHVSMVEKDRVESGKDESSKLPNSSKPVKRNKWKPEEVKKLIDLRGELHSKFQVVKGRMALWEQISGSLLSDGINRSPGQCKSLWTSLVLKYEETKNGKKSKKSWPYFEDMNRILSDLDVMAAK